MEKQEQKEIKLGGERPGDAADCRCCGGSGFAEVAGGDCPCCKGLGWEEPRPNRGGEDEGEDPLAIMGAWSGSTKPWGDDTGIAGELEDDCDYENELQHRSEYRLYGEQ